MFAGVIQSGWSLLLVNHIFLHSPPEAPGKHLKTLVRCSPGGSPAWCLCLATKVSDLSIISASPLRASDLHLCPWEGKYFVVKYFSSFFSPLISVRKTSLPSLRSYSMPNDSQCTPRPSIFLTQVTDQSELCIQLMKYKLTNHRPVWRMVAQGAVSATLPVIRNRGHDSLHQCHPCLPCLSLHHQWRCRPSWRLFTRMKMMMMIIKNQSKDSSPDQDIQSGWHETFLLSLKFW